MKSNVLLSSVINGQRIELVRWDDRYSVYIYDRTGLLNGNVRHFYSYFTAEQFYFDSQEQLAGSTP